MTLSTHTASLGIRRSRHCPVLLQETVTLLAPHEGDTIFDGTLGGGGHAHAIIPLLGKKGRYIGVDADEEAEKRTSAFLHAEHKTARIDTVCANARNLDQVLSSFGVASVQGMLFDLGISSDQLTPEEKGRGFSFERNEPLWMTLSAHPRKDETTAEIIVNEWSEETLADIIFGFGEERHARRIARAIVEARNHARITTSLELARIVSACLGEGKGKHPATKTFQALRIATNDELGALEDMLEKGVRVLASGGRMVVITFHSLEDRMVKHTFARFSREGTATLLSKKPIVPSREEVLQNRRSRSAKLRGLMKL